MPSPLPDDITIEESSDHRCLTLPQVKSGQSRFGGVTMIVVGVPLACIGGVFLCVGIILLVTFISKILQVAVEAPGANPLWFPVPFLAVGAALLFCGTFLLFQGAVLLKGHIQIVVDESWLTVIDRIGPFRWSCRRRRDKNLRFAVVARMPAYRTRGRHRVLKYKFVDANADGTDAAGRHFEANEMFVLRAECLRAKPLIITRYFPPDWSTRLAEGLSQLCAASATAITDSQAARAPAATGQNDSRAPPAPTWVVVQDDGDVLQVGPNRAWIAGTMIRLAAGSAVIVVVPNTILVCLLNQNVWLWNVTPWAWLPIPLAAFGAAVAFVGWARRQARYGDVLVDRSRDTLTIPISRRRGVCLTVPLSSLAAIEVETHSSKPESFFFATVAVLKQSDGSVARKRLDTSADRAQADWLANWLRSHLRC